MIAMHGDPPVALPAVLLQPVREDEFPLLVGVGAVADQPEERFFDGCMIEGSDAPVRRVETAQDKPDAGSGRGAISADVVPHGQHVSHIRGKILLAATSVEKSFGPLVFPPPSND